jgi:hypothetical protein
MYQEMSMRLKRSSACVEKKFRSGMKPFGLNITKVSLRYSYDCIIDTRVEYE